jgi:hypothetical protein
MDSLYSNLTIACNDGTIGKIKRFYRSDTTGEPYVVIEWGPLRWVRPARCADTKTFHGPNARKDAEKWILEQQKELP